MRIGEFAQKVDLSQDTIRYYEKVGLISPNRTGHLRQYNEEDLAHMNTIVQLKRNGFRLTEIKRMINLTEEMDQRNKLSPNEKDRLRELQMMFAKKQKDMDERGREIITIQSMLQSAQQKTSSLLQSE